MYIHSNLFSFKAMLHTALLLPLHVQYTPLCQSSQEHQEQTSYKRGPQGRSPQRIPGGDKEVKNDAVGTDGGA